MLITHINHKNMNNNKIIHWMIRIIKKEDKNWAMFVYYFEILFELTI
jgi:hypothetical protein